jgi:hypothetical protein
VTGQTSAGEVGCFLSSELLQPRSSATGREVVPGSMGRAACAAACTSRKYGFSGSKLPMPSCLHGKQTCAEIPCHRKPAADNQHLTGSLNSLGGLPASSQGHGKLINCCTC